jgi:hypothetical protein
MRKAAYVLPIIVVLIVLILSVGFSRYNEKDMKEVQLSIANSTQKYNINVIGTSDPSFDSLLNEYTDNVSRNAPLILAARPLALFIKNDSDHDVIGISLRWKFSKFNGEVREVPQFQINPGALIGLKPRDPFMIGKTSLINRGTVQFFSYFVSSVQQEIKFENMRKRNPNISYRRETTLGDIDLMGKDTIVQKGKLLDQISTVTVSLDGVFFENGIFVGRDENLFFDFMRGQIEARKDLLKKIADANKAQVTDQEILNTLFPDILETRQARVKQRASYASAEESFQGGYRASLLSMRKEIMRQRSKMPDSLVLSRFQSTKLSNFATLQKITD